MTIINFCENLYNIAKFAILPYLSVDKIKNKINFFPK